MVRNGTIACDLCKLVVYPNSHSISELKIGANSIDGESAYLHFHDRHAGDCWDKHRKSKENTIDQVFAPPKYAPT
jgi:hypothetical protein